MSRNTPARTNQETVEWFRNAKFGLFVHWGIYSLLGKGEWIMHVGQIPVEEYEPLQHQFNPTEFRPEQWADLAKRTGMEYMVITTKHHDGFCMWDTDLTDYNVMNTPYGRDIIREVTDAFRDAGLKVGYYHSVLDWHHHDYLPRRQWEKRSTEGAEFHRYIEYMRGQIKELLTNYGDIFVLWYDMGIEHTAEEYQSAETNAMARQLQPGILINDRAQTKEDLVTPEQRIPPTGLQDENGNPLLWEACITMTSHWWGYDAHETNFKSSEYLIRMLVDIVSKGGNLLLNIGPKPDGTIQQEFVDRMLDIGAWLDTHGEAIYGTTASPFNLLPFHGRVTVKGSTLYVHIFEWPADRRIRLPNLKNEIRSVGVLGGAGSNLDAVRNGRDWVITLPEQPSDPVAGVLRVELDGTPDVEPYVIRPDASGNVHLPALFGHITGTHGQRIRYETEDGVVHVGNWIRTPDTISWTFELPRAGQYRLCLDHRVTPGQGGSEVEAFVNGAEKGTSFKVMSTRGRFAMRRVAALTLKKGTNTVMLKPASIRRNAVMDLREAVLKPI